jgi:hypothetical protein
MRLFTLGVGLAVATAFVMACSSAETVARDDQAFKDDDAPAPSKKKKDPTPEPQETQQPSEQPTSSDGGTDASKPGSVTCTKIASCSGARDLGSVLGDGAGTVAKTSGAGSAWLTIKVSEANVQSDPISAMVRLVSPPGANYDLYVYDQTCATSIGTSIKATGDDTVMTPLWPDAPIADDTHTLMIEVRYVDGDCTAGSKWDLEVLGAQ